MKHERDSYEPTAAAAAAAVSPTASDADSTHNLTPHQSRTQNAGSEAVDATASRKEGVKAWTRAMAAWLLFISSWGPALAYGTFLNYYAGELLSDHTTSDISWIGSVSTTLLITSGAAAGPLFDRGYLKPLMTIGCCLQVLGFMMLSLSSKYYQILLAQGVCYGLGAGLVFVPGLAFVINSFTKRRAIAVGITASGSSVGGIIFPILFTRLQPKIGFAWTCRTIGFIQLAIALVALPVFIPAPVRKSKPRQLFQWHAFKSPAFSIFIVVNFCQFLAYWIPLFFIPQYARIKLGMSTNSAVELVVIINAASAFGRILPALIFNKVGAALCVTVATTLVAILLWCWLAITDSEAGFIVWCIFFGVTSGVFISGNPVITAHPSIAPSLDVVGTRMGMIFFAGGVGALIGNPIAGVLADPARGDFITAQAFGAAIMSVGAVSMGLVYMFTIRSDKQKSSRVDDEKG